LTSQDDKDWEEYQLGQQGTPTGSLHNQMGIADRVKPDNQPTKQTKIKKHNKAPLQNNQNKVHKNNNEGFNGLFAAVAFIFVYVYLYNSTNENVIASFIGAVIAGGIVGKLYKVIIVLAILVGIVFLFGDTK